MWEGVCTTRIGVVGIKGGHGIIHAGIRWEVEHFLGVDLDDEAIDWRGEDGACGDHIVSFAHFLESALVKHEVVCSLCAGVSRGRRAFYRKTKY